MECICMISIVGVCSNKKLTAAEQQLPSVQDPTPGPH